MSVRIAVVDPLPMFSCGVVATLGSAGFSVDIPEDLMAWVREQGPHVILLTLLRPQDWSLLADLRRARPDVVVVAVLDGVDVTGSIHALTAGASGVVSRDAGPDLVREVFEAAANGRSLLPVDVIRALASPKEWRSGTLDIPSEREIDWLRLLARGETIARLADRAGYSERMMFRLLRALYDKLRVANRTDAIIYARDQGWL